MTFDRRSNPTAAFVIVALGLALAACGGGNDGGGTAAQTAPTSQGATTAPHLTAPPSSGAVTTTTAAASSIASVRKANANVANHAELTAALQANGVANASMWAADIIENRPYPTNDPSFAKVRRNLAEDNLSPAMIERVIASLSL